MRREAFTLMELLVVISILLLLLGMLFPAVNMMRNQARKTTTLQHIIAIGNACETYHAQFRVFPNEQGITWAGLVPSWDVTLPTEHRECISTNNSSSGIIGLADLLSATAGLQIPGASISKKGPTSGLSILADGWGQALRYQRLDEMAPGTLQNRAQFWCARTPPPALAGLAGQREGFILYSVGVNNQATQRTPTTPSADSAIQPGQWWIDPKLLLYRTSGS